ncbi:MAG: hypothetical protein AAB389_02630, partial [Patescibacteria group bacterium]
TNPSEKLEVVGNGLFSGDLYVLGSDLNIGNGIFATSTLHGEYGKLGLGTTSPYAQFSIEADNTDLYGAGSNTPIFVIGDSGTSSSLFVVSGATGYVGIGTNTPGTKLDVGGFANIKGNLTVSGTTTVGSVNATTTVYIASSSPAINSNLVVGGGAYFGGGVGVGETPTTSPGHLTATLLHSETQIVARGLASCDTIDTDAAGVLKCGADAINVGGAITQIQYNNGGSFDGRSLFTFDNSNGNVTIGGDLAVNGSDINIGNGISATSTFSGGYGKLGLGTTSPFAQFAIESTAISGSNTPIFVIGDSGTSSSLFVVSGINGDIGIGTNTPGTKLDVGGFANIKGNLTVSGTSTVGSINATTTVYIATSSPAINSNLVVGGGAYFGGGVGVGETPTTTSGHLTATLLHSESQIVARGLVSCDTINTDSAGVLKCGTDETGSAAPGGNTTQIQYNNGGTLDGRSLFTFANATGNVTIGGDLFVNGSDLNIGNGIAATSTLSGGYGKLGFASTSPFGQVSIEADNTDLYGAGSSTPIFVIGDSGSSSSLFVVSGINGDVGIGTNTPGTKLDVGGFANIKGNLTVSGTTTVGSVNATTTVYIASSSPAINSNLVVGGGAYFGGGVGVGETPTTTPGHLTATLLHSETQIVARSLVSCDTINTDAEGVLKCGTDASGSATPGGNTTQIQYNNGGSFDGRSLFTFNNSTGDVTIGGDLAVNGSDINIGNGISATSTFHGEYGKLGLGTTSPYAQFAIEVVQGVAGSSTPIFVIGDSGSSSPILTVSGVNGWVGFGTATPWG